MAGAFCRFCGHRCFVDRVLPDGRSLHMATCLKGAAYDLEKTGYDYTTARNPHQRVAADIDVATRLVELRAQAQAQRDAYARMLDLGEGVGGLAIWHPEMAESVRTWQDATGNDHADMVLELLGLVDALQAELERRPDVATVEALRLERDALAAVLEDIRGIKPPSTLWYEEATGYTAHEDQVRQILDAAPTDTLAARDRRVAAEEVRNAAELIDLAGDAWEYSGQGATNAAERWLERHADRIEKGLTGAEQ